VILCCVVTAANPDAYAFQPENALKLKPWDHSTQDTTLLDLIPFLQMVQEVHVDVSVYKSNLRLQPANVWRPIAGRCKFNCTWCSSSQICLADAYI
jgi:hypothetical protein